MTTDTTRLANVADLAVWRSRSGRLDPFGSRDGRHLVFDCTHCRRPHFHGACVASMGTGCRATPYPASPPCTCSPGTGDGHRVAHCHDASSPYAATGYALQEVAS